MKEERTGVTRTAIGRLSIAIGVIVLLIIIAMQVYARHPGIHAATAHIRMTEKSIMKRPEDILVYLLSSHFVI